MTDTQGANCVGCYGHQELCTPNLDRLAAQGVRFDAAHTTSPVCTPARSALFTGTYPHTNGAWANELPLGSNIKTVGQRLTDQDVHAAYVGKWHLGGLDYFDSGECPPGWDPEYWYDGRSYLDDLPDHLREFSRQTHTAEEIRLFGFVEEFSYAHRCSDRAISFLEEHGDDDFFLVVSYDEPHGPSIAPPPFCDYFHGFEYDVGAAVDDTLEDKPAHQRHWAAVRGEDKRPHFSKNRRFVNQPYFACNSFVDYEIGRVVEAIEEHTPEALVVYTSDHGDMMYAHQLFAKGPAMYEEITRIPFIVRWPGLTLEGFVCHAPFSHIDVTPTVLHFFGLECPPFLQGTSRLRDFQDVHSMQEETIFLEFNRFGMKMDGMGGLAPIRCAYDGRYKLVLNLMYTDELYDLEQDPAEMNNLIEGETHRRIRGRLHREILKWMYRTRDPFRGPEWEYRYWDSPDQLKWPVGRRLRPADGYEKPALCYSTGRPYRGSDSTAWI